ncbi:serine/arginine repetitive matrix protein 1 isoform X2 [Ananas comosus]|uniref:Serine/arginine repetitive matrix protein 1 isoform X2 n=1 Tax=Ananas comosus TaxID=4615 RepID=A0A6P5GQ25_ANACO|nr:serine/arginine repetitive matrix protein 1 isoform X2 [Ananas comosus]
MSGGFFRGTSADQDTRFSNKQAKLLKTQKFAPELEHLVDMTKVKMDVIRPWIATRVTELLGFEDEVLINFIYGLLDGKEIDGKQIQIQLTGFMEKNTVKFMKELWGLLLSAQKNASGVPQQFLDAKEEEILKRKAENDKIALEIQKRREKEGRELEQEKHQTRDGEDHNPKLANVAFDSKEERDSDVRHHSRAKNQHSRSRGSDDRSPSHRQSPLPSRSHSRSISKSGSYSMEDRKLRNRSVSPESRRPSVSPKRRSRSPLRQPIPFERQHRSPRRSLSPSRRRSPRKARSPVRRRSPHPRRRSPSLSRRRSPSPYRDRSPYGRRRSPSFRRRRSPSPARRRSPSPAFHRSPVRRRPFTPPRRRTPSSVRRRLPLPPSRSPRVRRRSPVSSPRTRGSNPYLSPRQRRSSSPYRSRSPYPYRRASSREIERRTNGVRISRDEHTPRRYRERRSPSQHSDDREMAEHLDTKQKALDSTSRRLPITLRSPQRDLTDHNEIHNREQSLHLQNSPNHSESPSLSGKVPSDNSPDTSREEDKASRARKNVHHVDTSSRKNKDLLTDVHQKVSTNDLDRKEYSPNQSADDYASANQTRHADLKSIKKIDEQKTDRDRQKKLEHQPSQSSHETEFGVGRIKGRKFYHDDVYERVESDHETETRKSKKKLDESNEITVGSDSEEAERGKKRWHKKSYKHKRHLNDSSESDSETDKETKRRRKDEKRLRKEEKRQRREERHRRKLERRESKQKAKPVDTVTPPSDLDEDQDAAHELSDARETESEQKKLEFELRARALESLRAKKATNR